MSEFSDILKFEKLSKCSLLISPSYLFNPSGVEYTQETQKRLINACNKVMVIDIRSGADDAYRLNKDFKNKQLVGINIDFNIYQQFRREILKQFSKIRNKSGIINLSVKNAEYGVWFCAKKMYSPHDVDYLMKAENKKWVFRGFEEKYVDEEHPNEEEGYTFEKRFLWYNNCSIKNALPKKFDVLFLNLGDLWDNKIDFFFEKIRELNPKIIILTLSKQIPKNIGLERFYKKCTELKFKNLLLLKGIESKTDYTVTDVTNKEQFLSDHFSLKNFSLKNSIRNALLLMTK